VAFCRRSILPLRRIYKSVLSLRMQVESKTTALPLTDAELVSQARAGRQAAFETLVRRYQGAAIARAYALVGERTEAEDAAQEGFLRAFRSLGQLRQPSSFAGWLLQTVSNVARRAAEKRAKRPGPLQAQQAANNPARHRDLLDAIAALPEGYQEVVHLHYSQGYSCPEIAAILGLQVGSITSRLSRARAMLRNLLSEGKGQ
jgi:RNA polymerase sigma-70 factor (ECF subfamily)